MPAFSKHSKDQLATCHPDLITICTRAIEVIDFKVLTGSRPAEEQDRLFHMGRSKLQWPHSMHNVSSMFPKSRALDLAPWPIDWSVRTKSLARFYTLGGIMLAVANELVQRGETSHRLRWGGDWDGDLDFDDQTFDDLGHFELVGVLPQTLGFGVPKTPEG